MSQWPDWLPLREGLRGLSPYGAPQVPATAVLNTNENPFPISPQITNAISQQIEEIASHLNRYPDRDAISLRTKLAQFINSLSQTTLTAENVWAANGSNEIIQSLFLAFGDDGALGFTPSYSMHPLIARATKVNWSDGQRNGDFTLDTDYALAKIAEIRPSLTFITSPNNPTGTALNVEDIEKLAKVTSGLLVVDEAYAEFSDEESAVTLINRYPNVVVIRTMSKAFSFAGVRLGYLLADMKVIDALLLVRLPYHLSTLTQAVAEVALENSQVLLRNVSQLIKSRNQMEEQLCALGLDVIPSKANFLLFSGFDIPAADLWKLLLEEGVLIRDVGLSGYLRVTIGSEAENQLFITALTKILGK